MYDLLTQLCRLFAQVSPVEFGKRLWGDKYFNIETRRFVNEAPSGSAQRSFVEFILEPIYKIYGQVVAEEPKDLGETLASLGVPLTKKELRMNAQPLLKLVMQRFLGAHSGFVDMITQHVPSPRDGARAKVSFRACIRRVLIYFRLRQRTRGPWKSPWALHCSRVTRTARLWCT